MSKRTAFHERLDKILDVFFAKEDSEEVKFAQSTMEDGTVIEYENTEVGTAVMVIPAEGEPAPAPNGEYKIDEMTTLVVADGKIAEVKVEKETEEPAEEEMAADPVEPATTAEAIFNLDKLKELIDLTKDGFHTISLSVSNGIIEWGNVYSESFQELKTQLSLKEEEIKTAKAEFEEQLKILGQTVKETKVVQAPVEDTTPKVFTKTELLLKRLEENRKEKSLFKN